ncbi:MAG: WG repeat-containing protein [Oscillospiraceae bacterium]|jgi:hypothetical protein|nr:WG repeat-containing protein [Oscillospiraceae bacterium]
MKKILCAALLILAIAACAPAPAEVPSESPSAAPIAEPSESPSVTPPEIPPLSRFSLDERFERWYAEPVRAFRPSADYGAIYPFIGAVSTFDLWGEPWERSCYGFATADGKIVCDAVYPTIDTATDGNKLIYVAERVVERVGEYDAISETVVISADGSFAQTYEDAYLYGGDGYVSVKSGGKWGVIDFDGREIFKPQFAAPPIYGDGLFAVISDDYATYRYIDASGAAVLGPYALYLEDWYLHDNDEAFSNLCSFLRGFAFAGGSAPYIGTAERGEYGNWTFTFGYMDKNGDPITEPEFSGYDYRLPSYYELINGYPESEAERVPFADREDVRAFSIGNGLYMVYKYAPYKYGICDADENFLVPLEFDILHTYGGDYSAVRQGYYGGLIDKNGEWIVKVSLLDYLDD